MTCPARSNPFSSLDIFFGMLALIFVYIYIFVLYINIYSGNHFTVWKRICIVYVMYSLKYIKVYIGIIMHKILYVYDGA